MTWGMVAVAGATVVGSVISSSASKSAANQQSSAANNATALQKYQYDQTREDQAPWRTQGSAAVNSLGDLMGTSGNTGTNGYGSLNQKFNGSMMNQDDGYQFRLQQGQNALNRSAASKGSSLSGGTLKALNDYNQGAASQEYQNAYNRYNTDQTNTYNRLSSLAGLGQTSVNNTSQAGQNYANQSGQYSLYSGNANASATMSSANAWGSGLNTLANAYNQYSKTPSTT